MRHWHRLAASHRRQLLQCVAASLEFAARFNSHACLKTRLQAMPLER